MLYGTLNVKTLAEASAFTKKISCSFF